jgi:hypothetical protein
MRLEGWHVIVLLAMQVAVVAAVILIVLWTVHAARMS